MAKKKYRLKELAYKKKNDLQFQFQKAEQEGTLAASSQDKLIFKN